MCARRAWPRSTPPIAAKRAAAAAEAEAAREAARGQIEVAVADVASRAAELTVGRAPDSDTVRAGGHAP